MAQEANAGNTERSGATVNDPPDLSSGEKADIDVLRRLALRVAIYLAAVMLATFFAGAYLLGKGNGFRLIVAESLIGASGSAVAALTSCLDRYAKGYELDNGKKIPKPQSKDEEKKEMFSRGMAQWFIFRPFLGVVVAPIFIWGAEHFVKDPAEFTDSFSAIGFSAFMGGLLAKSVIDLVKGLFKNVFRA
jgi:hypothetical protein